MSVTIARTRLSDGQTGVARGSLRLPVHDGFIHNRSLRRRSHFVLLFYSPFISLVH